MLNYVRAWVVLAALLAGGGWILSAFHQLNRFGYAALFALAVIALSIWRPNLGCHRLGGKFLRRFRRPAPFLFLVLALMALASGALYVPTNIDSAGYRIPRVFHWLAAEQWHWIHTYDPRLNSAGCGFEWLSAPLILFTGTDRYLFLVNWLSYLALPGSIFSVFTRLAVRPRVAWWWMWILPSGWCFAIQAGGTGNDAIGATFALASVDFALRARKSGSAADYSLSMLAAAMLTGIKQANLPLLLPWAIAFGWGIKRWNAGIVQKVAVILASLLVSALPLVICNQVYSGNWLGFSRDASGLQSPLWLNSKYEGSSLWGIVGNTFTISIQNLAPPYFPMAERWNAAMTHFVQTPFGAHFASFDRFGLLSRFPVSEVSGAGVGPGVTILVLLSMLGTLGRRRAALSDARLYQLLRWAPWAALLALMAKSGTFAIGRYLAPYYPLLFPLMLARPGHSHLVRQKWWQCISLLVMLCMAVLLAVSQDRPLFPARAILKRLQQGHLLSKVMPSLSRFYDPEALSYADERNPLAKDLPIGECLGYASAGGTSEPGLWLPLGQRTVELVLPEDSAQRLRALGIHYVVLEEDFLLLVKETLKQWTSRFDAELISDVTFKAHPSQMPSHLYLVRLR